MANEKFSDFTLKTDLADFDGLVGFDTGVRNLKISKENLGLHLPTRFMLSATQDGPFAGAIGANTYFNWGGGNRGTSASTYSDGGFYSPVDCEIISISLRYDGRTGNPISIGVAESAVYTIAKLDTPNNSTSNDGANTAFPGGASFWTLDNADDGTFPLFTYTFPAPLVVSAGDIVVMYSVETGTVTPQSVDISAHLLCQFT